MLIASIAARGAHADQVASAAAAPADFAGAWAGTQTHRGETSPIGLELEPAADGKVLVKLTLPAMHLAHAPVGRETLTVQGNEVRFGPFAFSYDAQAKTLAGTMPKALVAVYDIPVTLRRVERVEVPARPEPSAPVAKPVWTFEAGSPLWAGASFADGVVFAGAEDGRLHALDARTGRERWAFEAGGAIRTRAAVAGADLYVQADDGFLYRVSTSDGQERWRVRVCEKPIERLPFDNPKSRYDRFGSDVSVAGGRLYLGTHDGRVLALDPAQGARVWEFAAGDSVLAAPAVAAGRVYFGSFDGHVYALDAATGKLAWKHHTRAPVVSTPAVDGDRVVVGSRSYDLVGLDAGSGEPVWTRYFWSSWVESSASIRDGVAYVGSSDAADVSAYDVKTGRRLWETDVYGWAWGQPAVTAERVYVGAASQVDYLAGHRGGVFALERAGGRLVWWYAAEAAKSGSYGFPGSPAVGSGFVFVTGLDGRVYAFEA
jgi:outer membrane protein assembly factor BamB